MNGFIQCIKEPTRVTDSSQTLIDVIVSNKPEQLSSMRVVPTLLSDHHTIGCIRKLNRRKSPHETITCRNYVNYNHTTLCDELKNEN